MDKLIGLKRIKENSETDIKLICETLIEILNAIILNPNDITKRSVKLDRLENLMLLSGGMETLFEIGFIEVILKLRLTLKEKEENIYFFKNDDSLTLPNDIKIDFLKDFINELNKFQKPEVKEDVKGAACSTTLTPKPPMHLVY